MKNPICFVTTLLIVILLGCVPTENEGMDLISEPDFDVNYYSSDVFVNSTIAPQLTIKDKEIQITALGVNSGGIKGPISKFYIADNESQTEWIGLLNEHGDTEFFYEINSLTREQLPNLYWIEKVDSDSIYIREYNYDWSSRLGTLLYETLVAESEIQILFDSTLNSGTNKIANGVSKVEKTFKAPIPRLQQLSSKISTKNNNTSNTNKLELFEEFDNTYKDLREGLKSLKSSVIDNICNIARVTNNPNRSNVCSLSKQTNQFTDETLFNDIGSIPNDQQNQNPIDIDGDINNIRVNFYEDANSIQPDIDVTQHINDVRNNNFDGRADHNIDDLAQALEEFENNNLEDLDDLPTSIGVLQFALTWSTIRTDIDLYVTDPSGQTIYYGSPSSSTGGYLDRDDTDGFGPENIYWTNNIPEGVYRVSVNYFGCEDESSCPPTSYTITISNGLGYVSSYSGSLSTVGQTNQVVDFGYSLSEF